MNKRKVTQKEFHEAINVVDCIHAPESTTDKSILMTRRGAKRIGETSTTLNKYGRTKYPIEHVYCLYTNELAQSI